MFKKGFTLVELLAIIVILAVIALIATPIVKKYIDNSKNQALKETINSIERAAYNYGYQNDIGYDTNYKKLTLDELISKGFLKGDIINPVTNEKMNGCVLYRWNETNNQYEFKYDEECVIPLPKLDFIDLLLKQYNEGNKTGLVKDSENSNLYYYTGTEEQVSNNYLWYGGHQWRVLEFDTSAKTITLISQQPLTSIQPTNLSWETKEAYESSYINNWLNDYFYNSLDSDTKENILDSTFNVGIYTDVEEITTTQKVGLIDEEQYARAGGQYSFLDIKEYFWFGNRSSSDFTRGVYDSGELCFYGVNSDSRGVRAVIKISNLTINEGNGSLQNSYRIVSNISNINDIQIGEYIKVPYKGNNNLCGSDNMCTFRVVNKDNESIKVVLNGLLPITSQYGSSTKITTNHTIYVSLNKFAEGISDKYRFTGNKSFHIGDYPKAPMYGENFKVVKDEMLDANIGLPTIGEMFSGNDIDMGSQKKFVDMNTIENPHAADSYWIMNRFNESEVGTVSYGGFIGNNSSSDVSGIRPVIFIKKGLTFTSGNGTAQLPYILE